MFVIYLLIFLFSKLWGLLYFNFIMQRLRTECLRSYLRRFEDNYLSHSGLHSRWVAFCVAVRIMTFRGTAWCGVPSKARWASRSSARAASTSRWHFATLCRKRDTAHANDKATTTAGGKNAPSEQKSAKNIQMKTSHWFCSNGNGLIHKLYKLNAFKLVWIIFQKKSHIRIPWQNPTSRGSVYAPAFDFRLFLAAEHVQNALQVVHLCQVCPDLVSAWQLGIWFSSAGKTAI